MTLKLSNVSSRVLRLDARPYRRSIWLARGRHHFQGRVQEARPAEDERSARARCRRAEGSTGARARVHHRGALGLAGIQLRSLRVPSRRDGGQGVRRLQIRSHRQEARHRALSGAGRSSCPSSKASPRKWASNARSKASSRSSARKAGTTASTGLPCNPAPAASAYSPVAS